MCLLRGSEHLSLRIRGGAGFAETAYMSLSTFVGEFTLLNKNRINRLRLIVQGWSKMPLLNLRCKVHLCLYVYIKQWEAVKYYVIDKKSCFSQLLTVQQRKIYDT